MRSSIKTGLAAALVTAAGVASAHPGHGDGLADGLLHPLLGVDHLSAMLAVGLWSAAALKVGQRRSGPLMFLAALAAGTALGNAGWVLPMLEPLLAATLLMLGAMIAFAPRLPREGGLALVASAGLLHGMAHGAELSAGQPFAAYAAGLLLSSAVLHGIGLVAGQSIVHSRAVLWRVAASGLGLTGLLLLARA